MRASSLVFSQCTTFSPLQKYELHPRGGILWTLNGFSCIIREKPGIPSLSRLSNSRLFYFTATQIVFCVRYVSHWRANWHLYEERRGNPAETRGIEWRHPQRRRLPRP